jgi:hypothetical protein
VEKAEIEDPREAKLPVWVREHISDLRRALREERARADAARRDGGPEDSDTILDEWDRVPVRLGRGVRVTFALDEATFLTASVKRDGSSPYLEILARSERGMETLAVTPQSSNVVRVRTGKY